MKKISHTSGDRKIIILILLAISVLVIIGNLNLNNIPFYAQEFKEVEQAIEHAKETSTEKEGFFEITTNIHGVYVKNTSYAVANESIYYSGQGLYMIDTNNNEVLYCLDPTKAVGDKVTVSDLKEVNSHVYWNLDENQKSNVISYSTLANELYKETNNELYLVAGQFMVWDSAGFNLEYSQGVEEEIEVLKSRVTQVSTADNASLYDASSQDLLKTPNAPKINNSNQENSGENESAQEVTNEDPIIMAQNFEYITTIEENNENILIEESVLNGSNFNVTASDQEDGDLTNNVIIDYSSVDFTKTGAYPIVFSVEDSQKNTAEITKFLYLKDGNWSSNEEQSLFITSKDISAKSIKSFEEYKQRANVHGYIEHSGEEIETDYEILSVKNIAEEYPLLIEVKNFVSYNGQYAENVNYAFITGEYTTMQDNPYLFANDVNLSIGEEYSTDMHNAFAYDGQDNEILTENIVYDYSNINIEKTGKYPVYISVEDSQSNRTQIISYVKIIDSNQEIIAQNGITNEQTINKELEHLDSFLLDLTGANMNEQEVIVSDKSEIMDSIKESDGKIPYGKYSITFALKENNEEKKEVDIAVLAKNDVMPSDNSPYVYGIDTKVDITNEEIYNPENHKAFAYDAYEGELEVKFNTENVQTDKIGVYNVELEAINSSGIKTKIDVKSIIYDKYSVFSDDGLVMLNVFRLLTEQSIVQSHIDNNDLEEYVLLESGIVAYETDTGNKIIPQVDVSEITSDVDVYVTPAVATHSNGTSSISKNFNTVVYTDGYLTDPNTFSNPELFLFVDDAYVEIPGTDYDEIISHDITAYDAIIDEEITDLVTYQHDSNFTLTEKSKTNITFSVESSGNSMDKTVKVYVTDNTIDLSVSNTYIMENEAYSIDNHEVEAFDEYGTNISSSVKIVDPSVVKVDRLGVYNVEFEVTSAKGVKKTEYADVAVILKDEIIDDDKPYIFAADVQLNKGATFTNSLHEAYAFDFNDGDLTNKINFIGDVDNNVPGDYMRTISVGDTNNNVTTLNRTVTILEGISLNASNYITNENEINDIKTIEELDTFIIEKTGAEMSDDTNVLVTDKTSIIDTYILNNYLPHGNYSVTISSVDDQSITSTVDIVVLNDDDVMPIGKPYVYSENVTKQLNEIYSYEELNAFAYDEVDGILTDITYTPENIATDVAGATEVIVSATNSMNMSNTSISNVFVKDETTIIENNIYLNASGFLLNQEELNDYNNLGTLNEEIIRQGNIIAKEVDTGLVIEPVIDSTELASATKPGFYNVSVTANHSNTIDTISKNIKVFLTDIDYPIDDDSPYVYGNNVVIDSELGEIYSTDLHNAIAFDNTDGELIPTIDDSKVADDPGVYNVEISATNSNQKTTAIDKTVTIKDKDSETSDDELVFLNANNIHTNVSTLSANAADLEEFIISEGNIFAKEIDTLNDITPTIDISNIKMNPGVYTIPITALHSNGYSEVEKTINMLVLPNDEILDPSEDIYFSSQDVTLQLPVVRYEELSYHNVIAYDVVNDVNLIEEVSFVHKGNFNLSQNSKSEIEFMLDNMIITNELIVTDGMIELSAENTYINVGDTYDVSNHNIIATDQYGNDISNSANITDYGDLDVNEIGVYTVTIEVEDENHTKSSIQADVAVLPVGETVKPKNPYIYAENLFVEKNTVFDDSMHNAFAFDLKDGIIPFESISFVGDVNTSEVGIYQRTISVTDSDAIISEINKNVVVYEVVDINADNGITNEQEINMHIIDLDDFIISLTNAIATDGSKVSVKDKSSLITAYNQNENKIPYGSYPVTLAVYENTGKEKTKNVTIEVFADDDVLIPGEVYIHADNVEKLVGETFDVTELNGYAYSEDHVITDFTYAPDVVDTQSPSNTVITVNAMENNLSVATTDAHVMVKSDDTVEVGDVVIEGESFTDFYSNFESVTDLNNYILTNSNAFAYDSLTGEELTVGIDSSILSSASKPGNYEVVLTASNAIDTAIKTIDVILTDDDEVIDPNDTEPFLHAENVIVDLNKGEKYDESLHNAFAYEWGVGQITPQISNTTIVDPEKGGYYEVTYEAVGSINTTSKTVSVIIIDENSALDEELFISAQDTSILLSEYKVLNIQELVDIVGTNVKAINITTGDIVPITYDINEIVGIVEQGVYNLNVSATENLTTVSTIMNLVLLPDDIIIDDQKPLIIAQDVTITQGDTFNSSMHNAYAWDKQDGLITEKIVQTDNVDESVIGVYQSILTVTDSSDNRSIVKKSVTVEEGINLKAQDYITNEEEINKITTIAEQ